MPSQQERDIRHPDHSGPSQAKTGGEGGPLALYQISTRASAGELAAGVVHDLNNPLQVMMLHLELVQSGRPMPNWIEMFGQQVQRIIGLTNRLSGFAHDAARERLVERIDIHRCIEAALELMKEEFLQSGIVVRRSFSGERLEVQGNTYAVQQVFLELFMNAHEAMRRGGTVGVETGRVDSHVLLRISDTGPGIPAEVHDEVFKPFVTTKGEERVGIGLAICARTISRMRGEIRLDEGGGGGAAFTILLPAVSD